MKTIKSTGSYFDVLSKSFFVLCCLQLYCTSIAQLCTILYFLSSNTLKDMNTLIGNCVRVRASGLPASYDAITMTSFVTFFLLASVVWSAAIGWMTPIIVFLAAMIIMFLILMGSKLVDPFGLDKVDIPMECFCATIEAQMQAIDQRSKAIIASASKREIPSTRSRRFHRQESKATFHIPRLA